MFINLLSIVAVLLWIITSVAAVEADKASHGLIVHTPPAWIGVTGIVGGIWLISEGVLWLLS